MIGVKDSVRRLFVRRFDSADTIEVPGAIGVQSVEFLARRRQRGSRSGQRLSHAPLPGRSATKRCDLRRGSHQRSRVELRWHRLRPRRRLVGRLGGGWPTPAAHCARCRAARSDPQPPDGAAWSAPRALCEPDLRAWRGANRSSVDRRRATVSRRRTGDDARVVAHRPSVVCERWRGAGGAHRSRQRDRTRSCRPCHAFRRGGNVQSGDLGLWMSSTGTLAYLPAGFTRQAPGVGGSRRRGTRPSICHRAAMRTRGSRLMAGGSWSRAVTASSRRSISPAARARG